MFGQKGLLVVTRKQFVKRLFQLMPYAFQHHQLEMVQREQLRLHIESITKTNGLVVFWMDYPENTNIIDSVGLL